MTLTVHRGGAFQIADTMYQYLNREAPDAFVFNKRVTSIKSAKDADGIDVITDDCASKRFSHVVTSIPLPVLRTIDLTAADLNPKQSNALRQLTYGPSTKIGMQFRTAWWTTATNRAGHKLDIVGGQTYTDSPLRTVVYPSFGDVEQGKTTTLIASYCWTDDADRLGALTTNEELKPVLVKLVLRELARIHDLDVEFLRWELLDTHAWSWSHDSRTMGTCLPLSHLASPADPASHSQAHSRSSGPASLDPCTARSLPPRRAGVSTSPARRSARATRGLRARWTVRGALCTRCS